VKKAIFLACLVSAPTMANDWASQDTEWQTAYFILHAADWAQTRYIAQHAVRYHENNPLLHFQGPTVELKPGGWEIDYHENENKRRADRYFLVTGLLHLGAAYALPPDYRRTFQHITIGMESVSVYRNYTIGVRFNF
jgi:hypothetical protein